MSSTYAAASKTIFRGPFFWLFSTRLLLALALTSIGGAAFAYGYPIFGAISELCAVVIAVSVVLKILQTTGLDKSTSPTNALPSAQEEATPIDKLPSLLAQVALNTHRGIVLLDATQNVVWSNALAAQYLGVYPEALAHFNWGDIQHNFNEGRLPQLQEDTASLTMELELADDNRGVWLDVDINKTADGGWLLMVMDVSKRKHAQDALERSETRMQAIHQALPGGLFVSDKNGIIIDCNARAPSIMDVSREQCLGRRIDDAHAWIVVDTDGTPMEAEHLAGGVALRQGAEVLNQTLHVTTPNAEKTLCLSAAPIEHPDLGVVLTVVDISVVPPVEQHKSLAHLHILVADDNAISLQIAHELLLKEGARVSVASSGAQVLACLDSALVQQDLPDLVLLDTQMPGMDGYTTVQAIRARLALSTLPVLAMSTSPQGSFAWSTETAFDGDITKPLVAFAVVDGILRYFNNRAEQAIVAENEAIDAVQAPNC